MVICLNGNIFNYKFFFSLKKLDKFKFSYLYKFDTHILGSKILENPTCLRFHHLTWWVMTNYLYLFHYLMILMHVVIGPVINCHYLKQTNFLHLFQCM